MGYVDIYVGVIDDYGYDWGYMDGVIDTYHYDLAVEMDNYEIGTMDEYLDDVEIGTLDYNLDYQGIQDHMMDQYDFGSGTLRCSSYRWIIPNLQLMTTNNTNLWIVEWILTTGDSTIGKH